MLNQFTSYLGSNLTPGTANNQLWALIYVLIIFAGVSVAVMAMNWLERKALAHFQIRLGPMRVGPHGLMQFVEFPFSSGERGSLAIVQVRPVACRALFRVDRCPFLGGSFSRRKFLSLRTNG